MVGGEGYNLTRPNPTLILTLTRKNVLTEKTTFPSHPYAGWWWGKGEIYTHTHTHAVTSITDRDHGGGVLRPDEESDEEREGAEKRRRRGLLVGWGWDGRG